MPSRTDWLLRFIAGVPPYDGWIDRIRVMKGMFLFQAEGQAPSWEVDYRFRPYDYGPFTSEVYRDVDMLVAGGLVTDADDGRSYRATTRGLGYLKSVAFPNEPLEALLSLRIEVSRLGFRALLRRVYIAHPESAVRSIAKDVLD